MTPLEGLGIVLQKKEVPMQRVRGVDIPSILKVQRFDANNMCRSTMTMNARRLLCDYENVQILEIRFRFFETPSASALPFEL